MLIGAASIIAAVVAFGRVARPNKRPGAASGDAISAPVERLQPVERPSPVEPKATRVKPLLPPTPGAVPKAPVPTEPDPRELTDAPAILATLHDLAASDPQLSLKWAREALERFPDSPNASEFEWNVVKALFNMGRIEDAKDEAQMMVQKYPDSYFTGDVEHHLLNPPPNPP